MADEVSSRARNHRVRVKVLEGVLPLDPPCEKNWKCDFIELDSPPVGPPINPKVLGKAPVLLLRDCQVRSAPAKA